MIVECIFSTLDPAGEPHFAPMGLVWGDQEITVRPFRQTSTYRNLQATGYGVASLTDDVLAYVKSSLYKQVLPHFPARAVPGVVYQAACSWRELQVVAIDDAGPRPEVRCRLVESGWLRDFVGFCRARNAVIEATIIATRLHLYDLAWVQQSLSKYAEIVEKTGDAPEKLALQEISAYVRRWLDEGHG
jgi:hypothetical protein